MFTKEKAAGFIIIIALDGRIDAITTDEIQKQIISLINRGNKFLIIDFKAVSYLASAGLRLLVTIYQTIKAVNGQLALCGASPDINNIFQLTGLTSKIAIYQTREEAIEKMKSDNN